MSRPPQPAKVDHASAVDRRITAACRQSGIRSSN